VVHRQVPSRAPRLHLSRCLLPLLLLSGCGTPSASGPAGTYGINFAGANPHHARGAVVFLIDGVNAAIFDEMLQAGELPTFRDYFLSRGLYCPRAVSSVPSVTLACEATAVTGRFPGHHGIVGINWFDRNALVWRNYETIAQKNLLDQDYIAPTLYEQFPDRTTFSLFFQAQRGATKFVENRLSAAAPYVLGWYEFMDRLALHRFDLLANVARARQEFPAITLCYQLAPDHYSYLHGPNSKQYRDSIRHTDYQVGRVLGDMKRAGLLDDLIVVAMSDHGHTEVRGHFSVGGFVGKLGIPIAEEHLWETTPFEKRLDYYQQYPCVMYGSGDRYWAICLRKPADAGDAGDSPGPGAGAPGAFANSQGATAPGRLYRPWPARPDANDLRRYPVSKVARRDLLGRPIRHELAHVDLLDALAGLEAVEALAYAAGPDRVRVRTRGGEVEFHQPGGQGKPIAYRAVSGDDPLGYKGKVPADAIQGKPLGQREWLDATIATPLPDLPAQIVACFRSRQAGDIALFAADGWDFGPIHRGGHGGLTPAEMLTPLLLAGPGVPKGTLSAARTADVTPTILQLLGRPLPPNMDGQGLVRTGSR
jgi:arylsulfatase A-like enzyme